MSEFKYRNDYERDETQKYEGTYTSEEIELNKKLFDECAKEPIDFQVVEKLLKQGADPLGGTEICGWGLLDHVYGDLVGGSQENESVDLPQITELFLKYGMDIDKPKIPYDGSNSINPMWEFAFVTNENAIYALKMLLDKGISVESFGEFWGHAIGDLIQIKCGDPVNDEFWNSTCVWTLKMLMLASSYDYILENDKDLKDFIGCSYNNYDVRNFREWNNYRYEFDTSRCEKYRELYKSVLHIYEISSNKEVWKIGVCLKAGEF
ncbi:MAG: hypothetical protein E7624_05225 [Ruminococcaceae bacterium]|nr:hypothetical protein [Oscillospiraceae bacterium]